MPEDLPELPRIDPRIDPEGNNPVERKPLVADSTIPIYKNIQEVAHKEYPALSQALQDLGIANSKIKTAIAQSELYPAFKAGRLEGVIGEVSSAKSLNKLYQAEYKQILALSGDSPDVKADLQKLKARIDNIDKAPDRITDQAIEDMKKYLDDLKPRSSFDLKIDSELAAALQGNITEVNSSLPLPYAQGAVKENKIG